METGRQHCLLCWDVESIMQNSTQSVAVVKAEIETMAADSALVGLTKRAFNSQAFTESAELDGFTLRENTSVARMFTEIFSWLLDRQRENGSLDNVCVCLASDHNDAVFFAKDLNTRGVYVRLFSSRKDIPGFPRNLLSTIETAADDISVPPKLDLSINFANLAPSSPRVSISEYANILTPEESALVAEVITAYRNRNVRATVAVLRKIYTRQRRDFQVAELLAMLDAQFSGMCAQSADLKSECIVFGLGVMHWCLNMPVCEKIDSYKCKMNLNIARWMLQSIAPKINPRTVNSDVKAGVQALAQVLSERQFDSSLLQEVLVAFGAEIDSVLPVSMSVPLPMTNAGLYSGSAPLHKMPMMLRKPPEAQVSDDLLADRLLRVIANSPTGVLGARIPALYRDTYGCTLRLQGRKLKDVLGGNAALEIDANNPFISNVGLPMLDMTPDRGGDIVYRLSRRGPGDPRHASTSSNMYGVNVSYANQNTMHSSNFGGFQNTSRSQVFFNQGATQMPSNALSNGGLGYSHTASSNGLLENASAFSGLTDIDFMSQSQHSNRSNGVDSISRGFHLSFDGVNNHSNIFGQESGLNYPSSASNSDAVFSFGKSSDDPVPNGSSLDTYYPTY